jgi:lysophospholipase L1-like esterase
MAKGGRSSGSYRAEGSWDQVLEELKRKDNFKNTYVLIQFGHNDQPGKPGRSTDLATEFPANMRRYVKEVKEAGAKPVLLTPLTRRSFKDGLVRNELSAWADATRKVGQEEGVPVLELNRDSGEAVQKMGPAEANTLAMAPPPAVKRDAAEPPNPGMTNAVPDNNKVEKPGNAASKFDYTHLGKKGSAYFGRMVADEFTTAIPELKPYFKR